MRFAVIADTHIGRSIPLAIAEHRRAAFSRAFSYAVDSTVKAGVDYVFICGDLFERRTLRPNMVEFTHNELYRLARETERLHGKKVKILVIRGNHDGRSQSDALDYIKHPLAAYLHVFGDEDIVYRDEYLHVVGLNYYDMIDTAYERLAKPALRESKGIKILLMHGFVSNYNEVPPGDTSISLEQLSEERPDFVFTGHYHRRCLPRKLPGGGWIITPGSTEVYDFAEDPDKGFYIVDAEEPEFRWVPIPPLHIMRQAHVDARTRRMPPSWYEERINETVRQFVGELRSTGMEGYIRVKVDGGLSDGWPNDIKEDEVQRLMATEPHLLWVDVDTLELNLPPEIAQPQAESRDVAEYFRDFGTFAEEIRELHSVVKESLEEEASTKTGLLTPSQRERHISEWLRRFEEHDFGDVE